MTDNWQNEVEGLWSGARLTDSLSESIYHNLPLFPQIVGRFPDDELEMLKWTGENCGLEVVESPDLSAQQKSLLGATVPAHLAIKCSVLPLAIDPESNSLKVGTSDPLNIHQRAAVQRQFDGAIEWVLVPVKAIAFGIQSLYGVGAETFDQLLADRDFGESDDLLEEENIIDESDDDASVVKFVNQIIRESLRQRATDIHIEPLKDDLRIRYRIDGVLRSIPVPQRIKSLQDAVIARIKVMSQLDIAEKRLPQDGRIRLKSEGNDVDVRVATIPCVEGENISMRLLGSENFTIDRLGMLPRIRKNVDSLLDAPNGIILVTGPTGCGKSTSLYCFLSKLNTDETRIVTIEDPVENKLPGVMQIAVKPEIDLTFAKGLRSILRGDPNIIMVGEIRDLETAEIAIRAALTGHLVLSTLHTNDAIGGISRLIDMGVEPFLIGSAVRGFMAQRLVRRLCDRCKVPASITAEQLDRLGLGEPEGICEASPIGCDHCGFTGYRGRLAIYELCMITPKIQDLIVTGGSSKAITEQAETEGFETMQNYGLKKVKSGETSLSEILAVTEQNLH